MFGFFMMSCAHAVPAGIPAFKTLGDQIIPYALWLFTIICAAVASQNGLLVCKGQLKAVIPALIGAIGSGLGLTGLFGTKVATLMI